MTPALYSFVWRPKFVFWLAVAVALLCGGALVFGLNTLTHSRGKETRTGAIYTPTDTVLREQVSEIFTIVHRIDSLSQTNTGKIEYNTERIDRLEKEK